MAGRKFYLPFGALEAIFQEKIDTINDERNKVVAPSNDIWNTICEKIEKKKTAKSIYNDALKWWGKEKRTKSDANVEKPTDPTDTDISIENSVPSDCESQKSYFSSENQAPQAGDINFSV